MKNSHLTFFKPPYLLYSFFEKNYYDRYCLNQDKKICKLMLKLDFWMQCH